MTTLELVSRKNTTEKARASVIEFINSFDFSNYEDLPNIESKNFNLLFDVNGNGNLHDQACFSLADCGFCIITYSSNDEQYCSNRLEIEKQWKNITDVFDGTCTFINFKKLVSAMEDFIAKINKAIDAKDNEISDFLEYVEGWKSYQDTAKNADEVKSNTEIL